MAIKQTEQREAAFKHVANILHSSINRSADAEQLESRHPAFSDNLLSFVPAQSEAQFNLDTKIKQIRTWVPATTLADGHNVTVNSTNAQKLEAIYSGSLQITHVDDSGVTQNGARVTDIEGFQYVEKVIMPLIMDDQSNGQLFLSLDWTSIRLAEGDTSSDSNFTFNFNAGEGEYPFTSSPAGYLTRKDLRLNDWLFKAAFGSDYNQETRTSVLTNWNGTGFANTSLSPAGVVDAINQTEYFAGLTFNPTGGTVFAGSPDTTSPIFKDFFGAQQELPLWIVGYRYIGPKGANLLQVLDDGVQKTTGATKIDFTGGGVTVTNTGTELTVNIPGSDLELDGGGGISSTGATGAVGFYSAGSQISGHAGFVFDNDPNSLFLAGDMTMSGILSASSGIISKLDHSNGVYNNVVTYDTITGKLFYTESYGSADVTDTTNGIFNNSESVFVTSNDLQITGSVKIDGTLSIPSFTDVAQRLTSHTSQLLINVGDIASNENRTFVNQSNIANLGNLVNQDVTTEASPLFTSLRVHDQASPFGLAFLGKGSASIDHLIMFGDIIPAKGHRFSLGSKKSPWRELWISGQTIYFMSGSETLTGSAHHTERGRIQIDNNANFSFKSGSEYRELTASHVNLQNGSIDITGPGDNLFLRAGSESIDASYISSNGSFAVLLDNNDRSAFNDSHVFTIEKDTNTPGVGGTRLFEVSESGQTVVYGDLNVTGDIVAQSLSASLFTEIGQFAISALEAATSITASGVISASAFIGNGSGLTGVVSDTIASSAISHLALTSSISGAFTLTSASFANRVTTVENATITLPTNLVSSSAQLSSDISGAFNGQTASFALSSNVVANSNTASFALLSNVVTNSSTASFVVNSQTASFVVNSQTGSFALTSNVVSNANTASFVVNSQTASFVVNSQTGSFLTTSPFNATDISGSFNGVSSSFAKIGTDVTFADIFANSITANQYIISSSVTRMTQSFSSGSTIFGDDINDTHIFTGSLNITGSLKVSGSFEVASGDIITTGTILASNLSGTNTGDQSLAHLALTSSISGAFAAVSNSFSSRVTTLEGSSLVLPANTVSSSAQLADDISGSFSSVTGSFVTNSQTGSFVVNSQTGSFLTSIPGGTYSSSLQILSHITASGNISASGDIYASNIHLSASGATIGGANTTIQLFEDDYWRFFANNSNPSLTVQNLKVIVNEFQQSVDFVVEGNSNNHLFFVDSTEDKVAIGSGSVIHGLSGASSLLTVDGDMTLNGTITASGNVSASGTIIASNLSGTNTGDQDLSSYIQNSQTGSFLTSMPGGTYSSSLQTLGNITASGNISASGNIIASDAAVITLATTGDVTLGTGNNVVDSDGDKIIISNTATRFVLGQSDYPLKINSNVTASGDISSSGTITATNYNGSLSNMTGTIDGGTF